MKRLKELFKNRFQSKSSALFAFSDDVDADSDEHAESQAGCVEDALSHHKAHREEQVGGRHEGHHHQR